MTYEQAKARRDALERDMNAASEAWRAIPGVGVGAMGLTPDAVKQSAEYQAAAAAYRRAHAALAAFNRDFVRRFKVEIREERRRRVA